MDFDSPDPDAEKEFPGLYASDSAAGRKKDDEDCKSNFFWCYFIALTHKMHNVAVTTDSAYANNKYNMRNGFVCL